MKRLNVGCLLCLFFCSLGNFQAFAATRLGRPPSGRGPEATALLIYSNTRIEYGLADSLARLECQLNRVEMNLKSVAVTEVNAAMILNADYVIVFCPQLSPPFSKEILTAIAQTKRPVLWIGLGSEQLATIAPFQGAFKAEPYFSQGSSQEVEYKSSRWNTYVEWVPIVLNPKFSTEVVMKVVDASAGEKREIPLCWKLGHLNFFVSISSFGVWNYLFQDFLLDFFEVQAVHPSQVYLRIEDYHCHRDHVQFRRLVDCLYARKHPFLVAVIPTYRDPATGKLQELESQPDFIDALRYAQQRGGRLVMHGYTHAYKDESGEGHEFWDVKMDRPLPEDSPEYVRERVQKGLRQMLKQGLFPLAWETPHYAGSRHAYREVGRLFSSSVERFQLSDATCLESFESVALTKDMYGRLIIPENMGFVYAGFGDASILRIQAIGEQITRLRGTIAGCFFHPFLPFEKFLHLVESLEKLQVPFMDLAEMDHWVQLPETILLTGKAERKVTLRSATVRWKAFDRTGKLLSEKQEPAKQSGDRVFKRQNVGDYEIFEITESGI
jgi:uncharacterized protein YdaL